MTIGSQRVPLGSVGLERLASADPPATGPPDIGARTGVVLGVLEDRFARVPFARVRRWADYWALRAVEVDHVRRLAQREGLPEPDHQALEAYWLGQIDVALVQTRGRLQREHTESLHRSRLARRIRPELVFQLWWNTLGPGARTWLSNRYTTLRGHTFRIRWRP